MENEKKKAGRPKMLAFKTEVGFTEAQKKFLQKKLRERGEGMGLPSVIRDAVDRWRVSDSKPEKIRAG